MGDDFQILGKLFFFHFVQFHLIFPCYYCSIDVKSQSEHPGPRPDTSSLVRICDLVNIYIDYIYALSWYMF